MSIILYDLCARDRDVRFSPYCWRAKMALAHKGLPFETVATPFTEIGAVENGASKTVPVINDRGTVVSDSLEIALYLDRMYPDRPALFAGEAAVATAHFLQAWAFQTLHSIIVRMILTDIHDALGEADRAYFRRSREARFGCRLEEYQTGAEANADALRAALEPVRRTLGHHPWLAGSMPAFADYIVFGTLIWLRVIAGAVPLAPEDPVDAWMERCLDLHGGIGRHAALARAA